MQALQIDKHGPIAGLKIREIARPVPTNEEVLVEVTAMAVNLSDVGSAEGRFPNSPLPRTLGRDFAGRIVEGPANLVGQEVWGSGGDLGILRDGTHAEYLVIPRGAVSLRPAALSAEQAAAAGVPFQTAWCAVVQRGALKTGEWVLVSGAAGAVGTAAIEIAASIGAQSIALVRNENEAARVARNKVAGIICSDQENIADRAKILTGGTGVQLAINGVGGSVFTPLLDSLCVGGRMVVFSVLSGREVQFDLMPFYRQNLAMHGLNTAYVDVALGARILDELAPMFDSGKIAPPRIKERYPLSKAAEAYGSLSGGKVVMVPDRFFRE